MTSSRRLIIILALPLLFACGSGDDSRTMPMFTTGGTEPMTDGMTDDGTDMGDGDGDNTGDGDGDPTGDGDGDGDPTGDGDGDNTGDGDGDGDPGECATDPDMIGTSCGQGSAYHGSYAIGEMNTDMPIGTIFNADNGQGNGAEDWYQVDFPVDPNAARPESGIAVVSFALNDANDYRFEVYRDCGAQAYGQGLAMEFGANAPPLTEWSFDDLDPVEEQLEYTENTLWPTSMWIRVFRFQNDETCNNYQLQVFRN